MEIPISISNVSPSTLTSSGGSTLTINGNYFPKSLAEANSFSDFAVTFTGGAKCNLKSVSSTKITCSVPAGLSGSPQVTLTFNGKTSTYATAFTVNIVSNTVTGVNKSVVSPVEKQDLVISVSHTPSSTASDYVGVLVSSERTIFMKVNAVDTSAKTLTARFPGAPRAEQFTLFVDYSGERYNSAVFLTAAAKVTGIEITTTLPTAKTTIGTTGGDTVKLTGEGFSTNINDNIVVFGSVKTEIVSATLNEIVVRAGAFASAGEQEVTAFLKPNIEMT